MLDGLFAVEEDKPHRVAIEFFAGRAAASARSWSAMAINRPVVDAPSLAPTKLILRSG